MSDGSSGTNLHQSRKPIYKLELVVQDHAHDRLLDNPEFDTEEYRTYTLMFPWMRKDSKNKVISLSTDVQSGKYTLYWVSNEHIADLMDTFLEVYHSTVKDFPDIAGDLSDSLKLRFNQGTLREFTLKDLLYSDEMFDKARRDYFMREIEEIKKGKPLSGEFYLENDYFNIQLNRTLLNKGNKLRRGTKVTFTSQWDWSGIIPEVVANTRVDRIASSNEEVAAHNEQIRKMLRRWMSHYLPPQEEEELADDE